MSFFRGIVCRLACMLLLCSGGYRQIIAKNIITDPCALVKCIAPKCKSPVTIPGQCCPVCDYCTQTNDRDINIIVVWPIGPVPTQDPCKICECPEGPGPKDVQCYMKDCAAPFCDNPVSIPGQCCPVCDHTCVDDNGAEWPVGPVPTDNPCLFCTCDAGETKVICAIMDCAPPLCSNPVQMQGQCCPVCDNPCPDGSPLVDPNTGDEYFCGRGPTSQSCPPGSSCLIAPDDRYAVCCLDPTQNHTCIDDSGAVWPVGPVPSNDDCLVCTCEIGQTKVTCVWMDCPPPPCTDYAKIPGQCCPVCNYCTHTNALGITVYYGVGPVPTTDPCEVCVCPQEGDPPKDIVCYMIACPPTCDYCVTVPDQCCPICDDCTDASGNYWPVGPVPTQDPCLLCDCPKGPMPKEVQCHKIVCPALACSYPVYIKEQCCPVCYFFYCDWVLSECQVVNGQFVKIGSRACSCERNSASGQVEPMMHGFCNCSDPPEYCSMSLINQVFKVTPEECGEGCLDSSGNFYPVGLVPSTNSCEICYCCAGQKYVLCVPLLCPDIYPPDCGDVRQTPNQCCPECYDPCPVVRCARPPCTDPAPLGCCGACDYCTDDSGNYWYVGPVQTQDPCLVCECPQGPVPKKIQCRCIECPQLTCPVEAMLYIPGQCCPVCKRFFCNDEIIPCHYDGKHGCVGGTKRNCNCTMDSTGRTNGYCANGCSMDDCDTDQVLLHSCDPAICKETYFCNWETIPCHYDGRNGCVGSTRRNCTCVRDPKGVISGPCANGCSNEVCKRDEEYPFSCLPELCRKGNPCLYGNPLFDVTGLPTSCGRGLPPCPQGFCCVTAPNDAWAYCCPCQEKLFCNWELIPCHYDRQLGRCVGSRRRNCSCIRDWNGLISGDCVNGCSTEQCQQDEEYLFSCPPDKCPDQLYWCNWIINEPCHYNGSMCVQDRGRSCFCNASTAALPLVPCDIPISVREIAPCDPTECECCIDYKTVIKICNMIAVDQVPAPTPQPIHEPNITTLLADAQSAATLLQSIIAALGKLSASASGGPIGGLLQAHLQYISEQLLAAQVNLTKAVSQMTQIPQTKIPVLTKKTKKFDWATLQNLLTQIKQKLLEILSILHRLYALIQLLLTYPANWCQILQEIFRLICLLLKCILMLLNLLAQLAKFLKIKLI